MTNKAVKVFVLIALVVAGVWLVARPAYPAAESPARRDSLRALAPGRPIGSGGPAVALPEQTTADFVEVDLSAVPTGPDEENGLYARWLRGEVDLYENESLLPAAEIARLQKEALSLPPSAKIQNAAGAAPSSNAPVIGTNFKAINYNNSGGYVPPDPELAAGPSHLIAVVNSVFAIYSKTGAQLRAPTSFNTFMNSNANCKSTFDPNVLYDEAANRFIMGIDANGKYYCVAVTVTGDPLGTWRIYAFQTATGADFFDYPHAGIGEQFLFMGANIFDNIGFKEARLWAIDKADLYAGIAADVATKPLPTSEDTPQPLNLHGWNQGTWPSGVAHTFFTDTDYNGATYSVWRWANPLGGTNPVKVGTMNLESYTGVSAGYPIDAPQNGSANDIQANDYRPHDFEYRNGFAWSVQTISCNPGGGTVNCLRWAKINPATATIVDAGVYSSSNEHRVFSNLAVNACGDMAIGYTKTSSAMYPSIFVNGREDGDPAGMLQSEALVRAGEIVYTAYDGSPFRWGDYTGMTIDPDGERFWYLGEFSQNTGTNNGRWGTGIASFTFEDCDGGGGGGGTNPSLELSAKNNGTVGGVSFTSGDIIAYDGTNGQWSMQLDASDVALTKNLTAFYRQDQTGSPDIYYLVFSANQKITGLGTVTPWDIVKFTPTQLGNTTGGAFAWYFDGSDVGLTQDGEKIDAIGMDEDGRLLVSLVGSGSVPRNGGTLKIADEDIVAFTPTVTGQTTTGTWDPVFDGSSAAGGLASEDVNGFWDDPASDDLYITLLGTFNVGGVQGDGDDILKLTPSGGGYTVTKFWDGDTAGFGYAIDGIEVSALP